MAWGLWFYFWLVILTFIWAAEAIFVSYLDSSGRLVQRVARLWGRALLRVCKINYTVQGLELLTPGRPYVFAANHQSQFDIMVLLAALPGPFVYLAKKSLFQVPIFGLAIARMGCIPVDRTNLQEAIKSLNRAAALIQAGRSVVVFPEGTRGATGHLLPFKKGSFVMAAKSGQPIVPVSISGTRFILPRGLVRLKPGPIKVVIAPPIDPQSFPRNRKEELMDTVRRAIEANFDPDFPYGPQHAGQ
jgi:1-acyl-sn-glycerol-3-phosphate acyltransferase